ncbi:MAG: pseudouridine synthase, partial [Myxococcota bacterium]
MTPEVLFQDGGLVAVQKPSGIPTTSPRGPSLVRTLSVALGKPRFLHPTSRLDAEVSGVVVFALSAAANRRVLEAREAKRYRRSYLAILPLGEAIPVVIDAPIGIDPADPRKRRVTSGGKPSRTSIGKAEPGAAG